MFSEDPLYGTLAALVIFGLVGTASKPVGLWLAKRWKAKHQEPKS